MLNNPLVYPAKLLLLLLMMPTMMTTMMTSVSSQLPKDEVNANGNTPQANRQQHLPNHIPTFSSVEELCQWLCQTHSPEYNYGCPPSCDGGVLDSWSKRAARGRRFDDFSFGLDDYLFMKLLGRNLGDKA